MIKQKHYNLAASVLTIIIIIGALSYCYMSIRNNIDRYALKVSPLLDTKIPPNGDIALMKKIENKLPGIAYPVVVDKSVVNTRMFGLIPYNNQTKQQVKQQKQPIRQNDYSLTFALQSSTRGVCIINNKQYYVGDTLSDGSIVRSIESKGVTLLKDNQLKWVPVNPKE